MRYYFDSAYIAKCYLNEPGCEQVRGLAIAASGLHSSAWCITEISCVFHRQAREGALSRAQAVKLHDVFLEDVEGGIWQLSPVDEALLLRLANRVMALPTDLFIRAGDAVHLVTAQESGFSEIWSNDRHLLAAAPHFGLRGRSVA